MFIVPAKRPTYPYVEPELSGRTSLEIEILADRMANDWGYRDRKSLDEVCTKAGVDIEYSHHPNEILLEVPIDDRAIVWLPRKGRKREDRVNIATALGYWTLHIEKTRDAHAGCGIQALYEPTSEDAKKEAVAFALGFLMPKAEFVDAWSEGRSQAASDAFDVPTTVTYWRAESLEISDAV